MMHNFGEAEDKVLLQAKVQWEPTFFFWEKAALAPRHRHGETFFPNFAVPPNGPGVPPKARVHIVVRSLTIPPASLGNPFFYPRTPAGGRRSLNARVIVHTGQKTVW
jgi:hypothetical protein